MLSFSGPPSTPHALLLPCITPSYSCWRRWAGRNITPVSRAVFKLTSKKATRRAATLAWLESAAANHEPGALALKQGKGAELVLLVKFVRDAREGRNPHASGESRLCRQLLWSAVHLAASRGPELQQNN